MVTQQFHFETALRRTKPNKMITERSAAHQSYRAKEELQVNTHLPDAVLSD